MSGFLIDTNVLSEYNRAGAPDPGVKRWLETTDRQSQYVSVITLAEIQKGIELLAEGKRRTRLEAWLAQDLEAWFSDRVLPVDRQVGACWASLVARGARTGKAFANNRFLHRGHCARPRSDDCYPKHQGFSGD